MHPGIDALLAGLTLDEKISLLAGADHWHTVPIPRLGIPAMKVTDGPNGARGADGNHGPSSADFPVGIAVAATWNVDLARQLGEALAEETKAKGAHVLLAPTVNIVRSPLAGRNFETYGEDPCLTGTLATAYIQGLQSKGVGACIKHFVANDSEFERQSISSDVDKRALHEIYLTPFRKALAQAHPWAIMSSYNRVNGTFASEHPYLLRDLLKGQWGFDGLVISDWFGTYSDDVAAGALDLEMPGPARYHGPQVAAMVRRGDLDEAVVDDKVRRLLRTLVRVGAFDHPEIQPEQAIDRPEHRALAREIAREAIVLLKNENTLLPLEADKVKSIAVIGENARWPQPMGGGSSSVNPHYVISPLQGIRERAGDAIDVRYALGTPMHRNLPLCKPAWLNPAESPGEQGLTLAYYDNPDLAGAPVHVETTQRFSFSWFGDKIPYVEPANFSLRLSGTFTAPEEGAYTFNLMSVGRSRLFLGERLVVDRWDATAGRSWGQWDESQEPISVTFAAGESAPIVLEYSSAIESSWRALRLGCMAPVPADPIAEAVALAASADVSIVLAGLTNEWESEGFDRPDMALPGAQDELIHRVAAANPNIIVVLNNGSPVDMPWLDEIPALLQAWYTGQEMGHAIADVLFGDVSPSGRLPITLPRRLQDNPAYLNYPGENGHVRYGEGLFVGYRYYDAKDIAPLFPFGYGLSYTEFSYGELRLDRDEYGPEDTIEARLTVTNTGTRAAQEVVQLYVHDEKSSLRRPLKELKRFAKVMLQPGEEQTVTFTLGRDDLAFYDDARDGWIAEPGTFALLAGPNAADTRRRARFTWTGEPAVSSVPATPRDLHTGLPLKALLDDPHGKAVLERHLGELLDHPQAEMALEMSLDQLAGIVPDVLPAEKMQAIRDDLAAS
ncbi:MAG: glycoside hydrolase family 3 C-terminal domain-containing protein [Anaerolineae bacterium]|nr:glycoside hydrolase family 3 C-terminal domain-containing protein [Anaerolineae bacterium]